MKIVTLSMVLMIFLAVSARAELHLVNLSPVGNPDILVGNFAAIGINSHGEIIGNRSSSNDVQQAVYYRNGAFRDLGTNLCIAASINDAGQIVGSRLVLVTNVFSGSGGTLTTNVAFAQQPVIFNNGLATNMFQGVNYGDAMGINDSGEIVGSVSISNSLAHGFAYQNGSVTDLGMSFVPTAVNNHGDIAGQSLFSISNQALLYHDGLTQGLGTLGGDSGSATAVNDLDEVVGWSTTTSNVETHAFLYSQGQMQDLGVLGSRVGMPAYSSAYAINNWGQIVGTTSTTNGNHAFLYSDGTMYDLNDMVKLTDAHGRPGFRLLFAAYGINDFGQIVGEGDYWNGKQVTINAFLLDVPPERHFHKDF